MIRLTKRGTVFSGSSVALDGLRAQFERRSYFRLPQVLEPGLLELVQRQIDQAEFYEWVHERTGNEELCMSGNAAFGALLLLMNDQELFQIIQSITQCDRIQCFEGRVYRLIPGHGHHDAWHSDIGDDRLIGASINLSREVYSGGVLQIRDRESGKIISEVVNNGIGDAVIFRLSPRLQHRITEVEGKTSKTAFAGWFRAQPAFPSLLREFYQVARATRS